MPTEEWALKTDHRLLALETSTARHDEVLKSHKETVIRIEGVANHLAEKIEDGVNEMRSAFSFERKVKDFALVLALVIIALQAMAIKVPWGSPGLH